MRILAILAASLCATAHAAVIDFENYSAGDIVTGFSADGVNVTLNSLLVNGQKSAMVFDTRNPTGWDWDLGGPFTDVRGGAPLNPGNVLIITEDQDANDPDDRARGGWFEFLFDVPITLSSVDVFDINANEGIKITLFNSAGQIAQITNDFVGPDNSFEHIDLSQTGVVRAVFELKGSGAISNLAFSAQQIPVPGAALIFVSGILLITRRLTPNGR